MVAPLLPHDTRSRLIESAILHFAAKGYDGTGIREIAKGAQANSALVAYHFCGKEGLYLEALKAVFSRKTSPLTGLQHPPRRMPPGPGRRPWKGCGPTSGPSSLS